MAGVSPARNCTQTTPYGRCNNATPVEGQTLCWLHGGPRKPASAPRQPKPRRIDPDHPVFTWVDLDGRNALLRRHLTELGIPFEEKVIGGNRCCGCSAPAVYDPGPEREPYDDEDPADVRHGREGDESVLVVRLGPVTQLQPPHPV